MEATSRLIIINGTKEHEKKYGDDFKGYSQAAKRVKDIKIKWNKQQDNLVVHKMDIIASQSIKIEARILQHLEYLKKDGGPFTSCQEIDEYLNNSSISEKTKKKRLKIEVQYARDSSLTLPRSNLIFRIRKKSHKEGKMQELTSEEFGENLNILLTKKVSSLNKKNIH